MRVYKSEVQRLFPTGATLGELLGKLSGLPEAAVAEAARKGSVWLQRAGRGKILRCRSTEEPLSPRDVVQFFYDPRVLKLPELEDAECVYENKNYGVWIKAPGVVPQGTQTGDHASLLRCVELKTGHEVFLVHRLDRETTGLMLIAYTSRAAALLGELFQKNLIKKEYLAVVRGSLPKGHTETIRASLDQKEATTHVEVLETARDTSLLRVHIETGRLHQIRRHLDFIGHPVLGDPKYGKGNKNRSGLQLYAVSLGFVDPWDGETKAWRMEPEVTP